MIFKKEISIEEAFEIKNWKNVKKNAWKVDFLEDGSKF